MTKPPGFWKNLENNISELRTVITEKDLKTFPSTKELRKLGRTDLSRAIERSELDYTSLKQKFESEGIVSKKIGWVDFEYTKQQMVSIMKEHNFEKIPSRKKLNSIGRTDIARAIDKYHDGFYEFRVKMGESPKKRIEKIQTNQKNGSNLSPWRDFDYAKKQAFQIIKEHEYQTLPCLEVLKKLGYSKLSRVISVYHGGIEKFREKLGLDSNAIVFSPFTSQKEVSEIKRKVFDIMMKHKMKILPTINQLRELGEKEIVSEIRRIGPHNFRNLMGFKSKRNIHKWDNWKNLEYCTNQAVEVIRKHNLSDLPSQPQLERLGYYDLAYSIERYHHGYPAFREHLVGQNVIVTEREQLENLLNTYSEDKT